MFTGIIETSGIVLNRELDGTNVHFTIQSSLSNELKIDQSIAHNGVCLTVVSQNEQYHVVTAIQETLQKTNLEGLNIGSTVNLERCTQLNGRLDGHIVQGHVDQTAVCINKVDHSGSWEFSFQYDAINKNLTVEKGSICINGVSLTVVNSKADTFSVFIIPYTLEHTNFKEIEIGTVVNLEFDIIGKYVARLMNINP